MKDILVFLGGIAATLLFFGGLLALPFVGAYYVFRWMTGV